MLSSEDAFSYVMALTDKSGSNGQQQADVRRQVKKRNRSSVPIDAVPLELRLEKNNRCGSHEGEQFSNAGARL